MDENKILHLPDREVDKEVAKFMGYEVYEFDYEQDGYVESCYTLKINGQTLNPLDFSRSLALTHLALLEIEKRGWQQEYIIQLLYVLFPKAGTRRFRRCPLSNYLCWEATKAPPDARCKAILLTSLAMEAAS